ncbi:MAG: lyso-ornithine lipid O-acyltransferase [Methylobacteriaceae bacterium]|nr:lyso-ornithine lipid O-acyltransferase [Methylobacteriaceae bacterium]
MNYLRGILALAGFALLVVVVVPLQWLAMGCGWHLQNRLPLLFCRVTCRLLGIRPRFHGRIAGPSPRMIVPNHVSWTDVLVLGCVQAPLRFVAKSEVAGWPFFGAIARLTGTIFVERQRPRSILRVNAALSECLARGDDVVLFAEATTGDGNRLKHFNAPHFAAARDFLRVRPEAGYLDIAPVGIAYTRRNGLPLGRLGRSDVAWYGDTDLLPHLWALVSRGGIDCEVTYGAPIRFERTSDRKAVARQTEIAVRRLLSPRLAGRPDKAEALLPEFAPLLPVLKAV